MSKSKVTSAQLQKIATDKKFYKKYFNDALYGLSGVVLGTVFSRFSLLISIAAGIYSVAAKQDKWMYTSIGALAGLPLLGSKKADAVSMKKYTSKPFMQNIGKDIAQNVKASGRGLMRGTFLDLAMGDETRKKMGLSGFDGDFLDTNAMPTETVELHGLTEDFYDHDSEEIAPEYYENEQEEINRDLADDKPFEDETPLLPLSGGYSKGLIPIS